MSNILHELDNLISTSTNPELLQTARTYIEQYNVNVIVSRVKHLLKNINVNLHVDTTPTTLTVTLSDTYSYKHSTYETNLDRLENFVNYVIGELNKDDLDEPKLHSESYNNDTTTIPFLTITGKTTVKEKPLLINEVHDNNESTDVIDPEEQKSIIEQNIKKLKEVKSELDEDIRRQKLVKLKQEASSFLTPFVQNDKHYSTVLAYFEQAIPASLTDNSNIDLGKLIVEVSIFSNYSETEIRLLLAIYLNNRQTKLEPNVTLTNSPKTTYVNMTMDMKRSYFATAVFYNHLIDANMTAVDYYKSMLIVYMLDYCRKTSALELADSPEAIVDLASGVYDIFLSMNLHEDIAYAPDTNNHLNIFDDKWYRTNRALLLNLDKIGSKYKNEYNDKTKTTLDSIFNLVNNRSLLQSKQKITHLEFDDLNILVNSLLNNDVDSTGTVYYKQDVDNHVIVYKYKYRSVMCMVIDNNGLLTFIMDNEKGRYQQHHGSDSAATAIKWLYNLNLKGQQL